MIYWVSSWWWCHLALFSSFVAVSSSSSQHSINRRFGYGIAQFSTIYTLLAYSLFLFCVCPCLSTYRPSFFWVMHCDVCSMRVFCTAFANIRWLNEVGFCSFIWWCRLVLCGYTIQLYIGCLHFAYWGAMWSIIFRRFFVFFEVTFVLLPNASSLSGSVGTYVLKTFHLFPLQVRRWIQCKVFLRWSPFMLGGQFSVFTSGKLICLLFSCHGWGERSVCGKQPFLPNGHGFDCGLGDAIWSQGPW